MATVYVTVNEEKMREVIAQAVVDYYNGKQVNVSGGVGVQWSGFTYTEWDENGNPIKADRTPGTWKKINAINGTISASRNGTNVKLDIDYVVQLATLN